MKIPFCRCAVILIVLLLLFMLTGCTEPQVPAKPERESNGSPPITEEPHASISFQEGLSSAEEALRSDPSGPAPSFPVYLVQAKRIDPDGKAEQWIFGMKRDDENFFIVVQSGRQILQPFPFDLPEEEINASSMIDPAVFLRKNRQRFLDEGIQDPFVLPALELSGGLYSVTVPTDSGNKVILFDAATGDPIS